MSAPAPAIARPGLRAPPPLPRPTATHEAASAAPAAGPVSLSRVGGWSWRPTRRAVAIAAVGFLATAIPPVVAPGLWPLWPVFWVLFVLALAVDFAAVPAARAATVVLDAPAALFIGAAGSLDLSLSVGRSRLPADLLLDLAEPFLPLPARRVRLQGSEATSVAFPLSAARRGLGIVEQVWLRLHGPLRLLSAVARFPAGREIPVQPNLGPVQSIAIRFFGDRQARAGLKVERFQGDGSDFESLKEWVPGDDHRAIGWKNSARHHTLVVRQFRAERDHQMVLAIDTGRLMSERLDGIPKLDHAVSAALVLSWVALRTGDRVGLYAFDAKPGVRIDPAGGPRSFAALSRAASTLDYSEEETNFTLGLTTLGQAFRRRSLLVVLTDFADTVTAEQMVENLGRLARRHLIVLVALSDPELARIVAQPPGSLLDLNRAVVGAQLARDRTVVLGRLRRRGVQCLDAAPGQVGPKLINSYLDLKRRERV